MILELADIRIIPGQEAAFEVALQQGIETALKKAQGFRGAKVHRGIENPQRFVLNLYWETLADHVEGFRGGPLFPQWRAIVGPFFAAPPPVEHFEILD